MESVVLVIHIILAIGIIGLVLLQRSTGGGLGIGGGLGDFAGARATANALTKATTFFAICFFGTSLMLSILASRGSDENAGVLDAVDAPAAIETPASPETGEAFIPDIPESTQ